MAPSVELAPIASASEAYQPSVTKDLDGNQGAVAKPRSVKPYVYMIGVITALSGLIFGYDIGGSGGTYVMDGFRQHFGWTILEDDDQDDPDYHKEAWITATFSLGAMFGAMPSGFIADGFGRKICLMVYSAIFMAGAIVQFVPVNLGMLYAGRIVGGFGVGGLSMCSPMYQAEMAPDRVRGVLVTLNQLFITFGILLAAALNIGFNEWSQGWRFSYGLNGFFALLLFILMMFLPDTPRWLLGRGRAAEARAVLQRTHDEDEVEPTAVKVEEAIKFEATLEQGRWIDLWSKKELMRARSTAAIGALLLQQFSGINAVMYFAPSIFKDFFGASASLIVNLALMTVNFFSTFLAIAYVEKLGRRFLLTTGALGMCITSGIIGLLASPPFSYKQHEYMAYIIILFTCLYILNFAYSWGPVAWLIPSEVFPLRLRGKGMTLSTASNWGSNTVIGFITPYLLHNLETWGTFLVFCFLTFLAFVFATQYIPETKGTTLEDVEGVFEDLYRVNPAKRVCMLSMSTEGAKLAEIERKERIATVEAKDCDGASDEA